MTTNLLTGCSTVGQFQPDRQSPTPRLILSEQKPDQNPKKVSGNRVNTSKPCLQQIAPRIVGGNDFLENLNISSSHPNLDPMPGQMAVRPGAQHIQADRTATDRNLFWVWPDP